MSQNSTGNDVISDSRHNAMFVLRAEEMAGILVEVTEKVCVIQDNLRTLDSHLGQLQDLSALAVDTLNLLSASDNQQQEVARLGQSQPMTCRHEKVSHSCCLRIGGSVAPSQALPSPKHYRSTPPSLLRGLGPGWQRPSLELPLGASAGHFEVRSKGMMGYPDEEGFRWPFQRSDSREGASTDCRLTHGSLPHLCPGWRDKGIYGSGEPSRTTSPTMPLIIHELPPSHEESMEEDDYEDDVRSISRASSHTFLLPDSQNDRDVGIRNPAFYRADGGRVRRAPGLLGIKWDSDLEQSRSLSASVEALAMPDTETPEQTVKGTLTPHHQRGKRMHVINEQHYLY